MRINSMEQVIINEQELIQELVDELAKEQSIYLRYVVFNKRVQAISFRRLRHLIEVV